MWWLVHHSEVAVRRLRMGVLCLLLRLIFGLWLCFSCMGNRYFGLPLLVLLRSTTSFNGIPVFLYLNQYYATLLQLIMSILVRSINPLNYIKFQLKFLKKIFFLTIIFILQEDEFIVVCLFLQKLPFLIIY